MSSTHQEQPHLLPPPKAKLSPMELRNSDLVSRLLAATPPYLYNMSLLPNTYFFSEMLRSFVQAKNEQQQRGNATTIGNGYGATGNMFYGHHQTRRSRKRAWNNANREASYLQPPNGAATVTEEKLEKPPLEKPNDHHEPWMLKSMRKSPENAALELTMNNQQQKTEDVLPKPPKLEEPPQSFLQPPQESTSNLVLPPPPPMWYPPIYPTAPYGIDPLHFFIDLRVSGHIYDRQNKEENCTIVSPKEDKKEAKIEDHLTSNIFNQKRHCSAFSVPNHNPIKSTSTKFDVKSMGFDKSSNKTSTNYIMSNISNIYKNVSSTTTTAADVDVDTVIDDKKEGETESEKQKRVKDLRALIGLELVVDYMSHKKVLARSEESSLVSEEASYSEIESCESPHLEVVG